LQNPTISSWGIGVKTIVRYQFPQLRYALAI
jgi:hypothetical protein